jgi:hypothetical protein
MLMQRDFQPALQPLRLGLADVQLTKDRAD